MGHCRSLQARSCDYLNKVFAENDEGIERRGVPLQITVRHQDEYGDDCMTVQAISLDVFNKSEKEYFEDETEKQHLEVYRILCSRLQMTGAYAEAGTKARPRPARYAMQVWDLHSEKMVAKQAAA